jgi:hypothetical protein
MISQHSQRPLLAAPRKISGSPGLAGWRFLTEKPLPLFQTGSRQGFGKAGTVNASS